MWACALRSSFCSVLGLTRLFVCVCVCARVRACVRACVCAAQAWPDLSLPATHAHEVMENTGGEPNRAHKARAPGGSVCARRHVRGMSAGQQPGNGLPDADDDGEQPAKVRALILATSVASITTIGRRAS